MSEIGEIIRLSVAPVFLLVAIGSFMNVVTTRLGRTVDRARLLEEKLGLQLDAITRADCERELSSLGRRMTFSHWSINFFALAALVITILVSVFFLSDLRNTDAHTVIAALFILAMAGIMVGVCFFLAEIYLATRTVRVRTAGRNDSS